MERKRLYRLKWIRAKRLMHDLLHQLLQMNKKIKQLSTFQAKAPVDKYRERIRHLNSMLRQQQAVVQFYEKKAKN